MAVGAEILEGQQRALLALSLAPAGAVEAAAACEAAAEAPFALTCQAATSEACGGAAAAAAGLGRLEVTQCPAPPMERRKRAEGRDPLDHWEFGREALACHMA